MSSKAAEKVESASSSAPAKKAKSARGEGPRGRGRQRRKPEGELFERLRALRMELAKAAGVPPYVVFHDATLREMALLRPTTLAHLAQLPGIGEKKLDRYGPRFLELLRSTQADA